MPPIADLFSCKSWHGLASRAPHILTILLYWIVIEDLVVISMVIPSLLRATPAIIMEFVHAHGNQGILLIKCQLYEKLPESLYTKCFCFLVVVRSFILGKWKLKTEETHLFQFNGNIYLKPYILYIEVQCLVLDQKKELHVPWHDNS